MLIMKAEIQIILVTAILVDYSYSCKYPNLNLKFDIRKLPENGTSTKQGQSQQQHKALSSYSSTKSKLDISRYLSNDNAEQC